MPYYARVVMFGDGGKGQATQVRKIVWAADDEAHDEVEVGITKIWKRKDRSDLGETIFYDDQAREIPPDQVLARIDEWAERHGKEKFPREERPA